MKINELIEEIGIIPGMNIIVHSSIRQIRKIIPSLIPLELINQLKIKLTIKGSLIMPTFTYCFKKNDTNYEVFDLLNSKSKVGALTEIFRLQNDVIRTSSPTHSFALWGKVVKYFEENNSPKSPLGKGSIMEWLSGLEDSYVLLLGCDFNSLTFGHYLEIINEVPWANISPWDHLGVLPIGVSKNGEQALAQVPGCSKSFNNFKDYLLNQNIITQEKRGDFTFYLIPINTLIKYSTDFFSTQQNMLICPQGSCLPCDERRMKLKTRLD